MPSRRGFFGTFHVYGPLQEGKMECTPLCALVHEYHDAPTLVPSRCPRMFGWIRCSCWLRGVSIGYTIHGLVRLDYHLMAYGLKATTLAFRNGEAN